MSKATPSFLHQSKCSPHLTLCHVCFYTNHCMSPHQEPCKVCAYSQFLGRKMRQVDGRTEECSNHSTMTSVFPFLHHPVQTHLTSQLSAQHLLCLSYPCSPSPSTSKTSCAFPLGTKLSRKLPQHLLCPISGCPPLCTKSTLDSPKQTRVGGLLDIEAQIQAL